jgi:hypothetical protein
VRVERFEIQDRLILHCSPGWIVDGTSLIIMPHIN